METKQNMNSSNSLKYPKLLLPNRFPDELLVTHSPEIQHFDMSPWNDTDGNIENYSPDLERIKNLMFDTGPQKLGRTLDFQKNAAPYYPNNNDNFNSQSDTEFNFSTPIPGAHSYATPKLIQEVFPHLSNVNDLKFNAYNVSPEAIKYHIWTTTSAGKQTLNKAWTSFKTRGLEPEIYLIFSVVESNHFLGIAKLASNVNDNATFKYWWEPCKWFGSFQVQWLFIKDVHYSNFDYLKQELVDNPKHYSSVVNLRDTTKIDLETGKKILEIFAKHPSEPNIFESFAFMDTREDYIRVQRDQDPEFQEYFEEMCTYYKQNPEKFRPQTNQNYYKKDYKKNNTQRSNNNLNNIVKQSELQNKNNSHQSNQYKQKDTFKIGEIRLSHKGDKGKKSKKAKFKPDEKEKEKSFNKVAKGDKESYATLAGNSYYQKY